MNGLIVEAVAPGSISEEMGVEPGDRLLAVNHHPLRDIIDYSFHTAADDELLLEFAKQDGEIWELEIEREPGESLGLTFPAPEPARCRNNCVFCFVHQLPRGLRKPLYVKDEDYRLSFLNGNYVTLANLKSAELARIIEQRLSPLYISVHATNPALREQLLGRPGIPPSSPSCGSWPPAASTCTPRWCSVRASTTVLSWNGPSTTWLDSIPRCNPWPWCRWG
jgi:putative radical SAM enzyme (TIGR03279 family)